MKKGVTSVLAAVLGATSGAAAAGYAVSNAKNKEIVQQRERATKNAAVIDALARWISIMQSGKSLSEYFEKNGYKTVAIYGYHYIGERLLTELEQHGIVVKYAIDQNRNAVQSEIEVKRLSDDLEEVDVVVVTPIFYFNAIEAQLQEIFDCPIVSFDEVLSEME